VPTAQESGIDVVMITERGVAAQRDLPDVLDLFPTLLKSVENLRYRVDWQDYRGRDLRSVGREDSSTTGVPILGEYTAQHTLVPRVMDD
jgi:hypothetical protein